MERIPPLGESDTIPQLQLHTLPSQGVLQLKDGCLKA